MQRGAKFCKSHVKKLTVAQMKAVCYIDCGGLIINGKAAELRTQLTELLDDDDLDIPEYPTQDDVIDAVSEESVCNSVSIEMEVEFDSMNVGDCVEVYWSGEDTWYEGEIIDLDTEDRTFKVHYVVDNKKLWHKPSEYKCRFAC